MVQDHSIIAEEYFQTITWTDPFPVEAVISYYSGTDTLYIKFKGMGGRPTFVHPLRDNVSIQVDRDDRKSICGIMIEGFLVSSLGEGVRERINRIWEGMYKSP